MKLTSTTEGVITTAILVALVFLGELTFEVASDFEYGIVLVVAYMVIFASFGLYLAHKKKILSLKIYFGVLFLTALLKLIFRVGVLF